MTYTAAIAHGQGAIGNGGTAGVGVGTGERQSAAAGFIETTGV